jgi:ATP-dependent Clp protease ATP-binding subunit ClpC
MLESKISRKLTFHARHSIKEASEIARSTGASAIEPKHLLLAIFLEKGSLGSMLLENMGFEQETLNTFCLQTSPAAPPKKTSPKKGVSTPTFSLSLKAIITRAYSLASRFSYPYVGSEHLIYSLIESADADIENILKAMSVEKKDIASAIKANLGAENLPNLSKMFNLPEISLSRKQSRKIQPTPFLDQYGVDIMEEATQNNDLITGRSEEIRRMIQILGRKNKNNPLLIGEPGVGKTTLVNALAQRILNNEAGPLLADKKIIALDLALVVAGTNFRGEFEARLKEIIHEASLNPNVILFIDEIHTIIGAGNTSGGLDAANILKPALSRGEIQCIGATTLAEYKRHIEKDPAFERRFQPIHVTEPTPEEAKRILLESKETYETFHNTIITPEAIEAAVDLSVRYLSDRFLPDKAFDLLDEAASYVRQGSPVHPLVLTLQKLEREKVAQAKLKETLVKKEKFEEAARLREEEKRLSQRIRQIKARLTKTQKRSSVVLDTSHIAQVVSHITRIPQEKISSQQHAKLATLEHALNRAIIGQGETTQKITNTLLRSFSGISSHDRPLGSFLFLGPSGVGKTLTAKVLAETLFEDRHSLIRIDMSEFMERHSIAQMIGAPAGYVGYGEGGKLTEQIRRRPYSVVLFDEIEKAHPDVFNILLQILDEGMLTDAEGRKVSFRSALIILTSNIGTQAFTKSARIGFQDNVETLKLQTEFEHIKKDVLEELKQRMRPELLNRLDHITVFNPLSKADLEGIARLELNALKSRLAQRTIAFRYDKKVVQFLIEKSFAVSQGARLVRKNIQDFIESVIAQELMRSPQAASVACTVRNNTIICTNR